MTKDDKSIGHEHLRISLGDTSDRQHTPTSIVWFEF